MRQNAFAEETRRSPMEKTEKIIVERERKKERKL
jgi:hypothetical protein